MIFKALNAICLYVVTAGQVTSMLCTTVKPMYGGSAQLVARPTGSDMVLHSHSRRQGGNKHEVASWSRHLLQLWSDAADGTQNQSDQGQLPL